MEIRTVSVIISYHHLPTHINFTWLLLNSLWSDLGMWGHYLIVLSPTQLNQPNSPPTPTPFPTFDLVIIVISTGWKLSIVYLKRNSSIQIELKENQWNLPFNLVLVRSYYFFLSTKKMLNWSDQFRVYLEGKVPFNSI